MLSFFEENTAGGAEADVSSGNLTNATAIGAGAVVNASNKIRLGNASVSVLEAPVALTIVSDRSKKERFQLVWIATISKSIFAKNLPVFAAAFTKRSRKTGDWNRFSQS